MQQCRLQRTCQRYCRRRSLFRKDGFSTGSAVRMFTDAPSQQVPGHAFVVVCSGPWLLRRPGIGLRQFLVPASGGVITQAVRQG